MVLYQWEVAATNSSYSGHNSFQAAYKRGYEFTTRRSNNTLSPEVTSVVGTFGTSSAKTTAKPLGAPQLVIGNPQDGPKALTK